MAKCVITPVSVSPGECTTAFATASASSASRVPSRPRPVSSFTCTLIGPETSASTLEQLDEVQIPGDDLGPRFDHRDSQLLFAQRAKHQRGAADARA